MLQPLVKFSDFNVFALSHALITQPFMRPSQYQNCLTCFACNEKSKCIYFENAPFVSYRHSKVNKPAFRRKEMAIGVFAEGTPFSPKTDISTQDSIRLDPNYHEILHISPSQN